jgi:hypothetical protein
VQIYVSKNQQQLGPYTSAEARSRILTGQLTGADLAWHEDLPAWVTLSEILSSLPAPLIPGPLPTGGQPTARVSGFAIASLAASVVGAIGWVVLLIFAIAADQHGKTKNENDPMMIVLGLLMIGGLVVNVLGVVAAIVALIKRSPQKWMAIMGIIFNGLEFLVVIVLMIVGLAMK